MLFYMYQIFSSLRSHLHFFVHIFFTFMEYFFWTPYIYDGLKKKTNKETYALNVGYQDQVPRGTWDLTILWSLISMISINDLLDAPSILYKRLCPSVGPSVRPVLFSKVKSTHTRRILFRVSFKTGHIRWSKKNLRGTDGRMDNCTQKMRKCYPMPWILSQTLMF